MNIFVIEETCFIRHFLGSNIKVGMWQDLYLEEDILHCWSLETGEVKPCLENFGRHSSPTVYYYYYWMTFLKLQACPPSCLVIKIFLATF